MFDSLSTRLQDVFQSLRGEARLTRETVEAALREIRLALLEADVNFKVVKAFIDRVRDRAVDQEVLKSLTPAQQVVRIVRDEMLALFGDAAGRAAAVDAASPRVILLLGPAGLGQDDDVGQARRRGWRSRAGIRCWCRPTCGGRRRSSSCRCSAKQAGVRVHDPAGEMDPVARAQRARSPRRRTAASTSSSSTPPAGCTSTTS